jgi:hypothetical protein
VSQSRRVNKQRVSARPLVGRQAAPGGADVELDGRRDAAQPHRPLHDASHQLCRLLQAALLHLKQQLVVDLCEVVGRAQTRLGAISHAAPSGFKQICSCRWAGRRKTTKRPKKERRRTDCSKESNRWPQGCAVSMGLGTDRQKHRQMPVQVAQRLLLVAPKQDPPAQMAMARKVSMCE